MTRQASSTRLNMYQSIARATERRGFANTAVKIATYTTAPVTAVTFAALDYLSSVGEFRPAAAIFAVIGLGASQAIQAWVTKDFRLKLAESKIKELESPSGKTLGFRYESLVMLGRGGMGMAFLGRNVLEKKLVVIKAQDLYNAAHNCMGNVDFLAKILARMMTEAVSTAKLKDEHIVSVHTWEIVNYETFTKVTGQTIPDEYKELLTKAWKTLQKNWKQITGQDPDPDALKLLANQDPCILLVMEYLKGVSLESAMMIARKMGLAGADLEFVAEVGKQMAFALDACKGGHVTHRDVKPDNLMVVNQAPIALKLIDFGIARQDEVGGAGRSMTTVQEIIGTPGYMSPEQIDRSISGGNPVNWKSDLYSMVAVLWELVVGSPDEKEGEETPANLDQGKNQLELINFLDRTYPKPHKRFSLNCEAFLQAKSSKLVMDIDAAWEKVRSIIPAHELEKNKMDHKKIQRDMLDILQRIFQQGLAYKPEDRYRTEEKDDQHRDKDIEALVSDLFSLEEYAKLYKQWIDYLEKMSAPDYITPTENVPVENRLERV